MSSGRVRHTITWLSSAAYQVLQLHCVRSDTGRSCVTFPPASSFCRRCACSSASATRRCKASRACSRLLACACTVCRAAAAAVASACSLSSLLCSSAILSCSRVACNLVPCQTVVDCSKGHLIVQTLSCRSVHSLQSSRQAQHSSCSDSALMKCEGEDFTWARDLSAAATACW